MNQTNTEQMAKMMAEYETRSGSRELLGMINEKILVLDGAMGTSLQKMELSSQDFGGDELDGCNENLNITRPDAIMAIHDSFLHAGADIIETNSFGSSPLVLAEYGLGDQAEKISCRAAELARQSADTFSAKGRRRFVAASIGPTTKAMSLMGGVSFDQMVGNYLVQLRGLQQGGCDFFMFETAQDSLNLKAAGYAAILLRQQTGIFMPLLISGTIETMGTMLAGQNIEAMAISVEHLAPMAVGLNCATGPEQMRDHIRSLDQFVSCSVSCMPNAGLPDEFGHYLETPEKLAQSLGRFADKGWLNFVGGCCGTTPEHIRLIADMAQAHKPRLIPTRKKISYLSGIESLIIESENRPYLIAERTNVIGSKKFRDMVEAGRLEEGAELARKQIHAGAAIVDVCLANPDRDELVDMHSFLPILIKKVKAPIMIDSTNSQVIHAALKYLQGKAIINSINLEDGEERFDSIVPLAKEFGAALVVGTIDEDPEQGMAVSLERKLAIAERCYDLLTKKHGFPEQDIYFDALVFPVGTGDEQYIGSAQATIEGIKAIKERFPYCKTTLGISNISFGLPGAGREVLNSVFLYHCVKSGLDTAIVNSQKLERYTTISVEEKLLAEKLIFHQPENYNQILAQFSDYFRGKKKIADKPAPNHNLSPQEKVIDCVLQGSKEGLIDNLEILRLQMQMAPMSIINGPLMEGMQQVGRLFNDNQLIVAEVLQSAEVMKASVTHLEQFMTKEDKKSKAKMVLATVKGDVHDIGKNLVDIVLSNNGYEVVNIGIKMPPEQIIEAYRQHQPDFIGLSGLLVKSAQQMIATAADLRDAGISVPLIVGGAALSQNFVTQKIAHQYGGLAIYAKDAMDGLDIVNKLSDPEKSQAITSKWRQLANPSDSKTIRSRSNDNSEAKAEILSYDYVLKPAPDLKKHILPGEGILRDDLLESAFAHINPGMLFKKHLGFRGDTKQAKAMKDPKFMQLQQVVTQAKDMMLRDSGFGVRAVYRFFRANSEGDDVILFSDDQSRQINRIHFPRQLSGSRLCAADFVAPVASGLDDFIAIFVVSAGYNVRAQADKLKEAGEYLLSHTLQAVALETAEGAAEWLHQKLRQQWGFADPTDWTLTNLIRTEYQGIRLSFGYPACPSLADQAIIWQLLEPQKAIDVTLTEEYMMDPEASVSALVFQHPQARYFGV